uniref:Uncharacterized protein n=1 Tax=Glossina brevipalpis TaxID=37001 RepID=A0A1A9W2E1_9MUSC
MALRKCLLLENFAYTRLTQIALFFWKHFFLSIMSNTEEIICNGNVITVPTLEVVRNIPSIMSAGTNIDWLLHIYYSRRDFIRCKRLIDRELYKHLNAEYLYFIKGLIDREEGNNIEALRYLQKSLELNSKNIEIYKEIGKTLFMMGRYNQSLDTFREAEDLSTRLDHEIFHFIGELLLRSSASRNQIEMALKEQQEAKQYFQKAIQTGKKLESFQRLAEIHRKEKDYSKAIEVLESCLLLCPENTEVLTEIGVLYLKMNETQKAFDRLLEVIQFDKKCLRGLMAFGAILQAISSLRKSIWLSPLNYNSLYNLSLIYISAQQYVSAFHTLAAAINIRQDNAECFMLLGICLRKLEDFDNAYVAFERATAMLSSSPLLYLNFALFCYETGRLAVAAEQYNRFVSSSEDLMRLPTEYKFQATKLKSLLKISSSHLLVSPTNDTNCNNNNKNSKDNSVDDGDNTLSTMKECPDGMSTSGDEQQEQQKLEVPSEGNATVN